VCGNIKTDERTEGTTTTLELEYGNGDRLIHMDVMYAGFAGVKTGQ